LASPLKDWKIGKLRKIVRDAQYSAAKHIRGIVNGTDPESSVPWAETSTRTRVAMNLVSLAAAEARSENAPVAATFGVVLMQPRLKDAGEWEAMAARVQSGQVIEATATPALAPAEVKGGG